MSHKSEGSQHLATPANASGSIGLALGSAIFSEQAWAQIAWALDLSGRELQIVRGVFNDRTELRIAADLGISPNTVHTHFARLHHKLGVATRTGVVLRITRQYLTLTTSPQNPLPVRAGTKNAPADHRPCSH